MVLDFALFLVLWAVWWWWEYQVGFPPYLGLYNSFKQRERIKLRCTIQTDVKVILKF